MIRAAVERGWIVMKFFKYAKLFGLITWLCLLPLLMSSPKALDVKYIQEQKNDTKIVILNYHKIDDVKIALSVAPADFDEQMSYLKAKGYHSITPDQLLDNLENGAPLPDKPLLITFDDGYLDNYTNAYPILKKYGFTATIFVVTDFLDREPQYITWAQARELTQAGFKIASHTMQHKSLVTLSDEEIKSELVGSAAALNYQLGKQSQYLAYPTGTYNLRIAAMLKEAGYRGAFTIKYGNVDKASNFFALERVPVFRTDNTFKSFYRRLQYIPIFERLGWIKS